MAGTAEAALGTQAESPTREWYHVARTLRTLGGTRVAEHGPTYRYVPIRISPICDFFRIADHTGVDRSGHDPTAFVVRNQSREMCGLQWSC